MISLTSNADVAMPILLMGVGGNGSYAVQSISQLINVSGKNNVSLMIADPDIVEEHNLNNQLFVSNDIGKSKSKVLAKRYANIYKVPIFASEKFSTQFIQSVQDIVDLSRSGLSVLSSMNHKVIPIIIGCVDNVFTRKIIGQHFEYMTDVIYIDVGVEAVNVKLEDQMRTGWNGQIIVGFKYNGQIISNPYQKVFPDNVETTDNPASISCQQAVVSNPQRIYTNRMAANTLLGVLNPILTEQCLLHSQVFFNALTLETKATLI